MKELVTYLARSLAGRPGEVVVTDSVGEKGTTIELKVADEDLNHLIGKQGRTVKAMRSLLSAASAKDGRRYFLKISSVSSENGAEPEAEGAVDGCSDADDCES